MLVLQAKAGLRAKYVAVAVLIPVALSDFAVVV